MLVIRVRLHPCMSTYQPFPTVLLGVGDVYMSKIYVHISHLNHDEGLIFAALLRVSVDTGYLDWLLEEGAHVAEVGLVHLLQEAALLLLWSVAYQPLQHHSRSATLAV